MPSQVKENPYRYQSAIAYLADLVGADVARNLIRVTLVDEEIDAATESTLSDVAAALASNGSDELQVDQQSPISLEDSGGSAIDPATETTLALLAEALESNANDVLQTTPTAPTGIADSSGTQIDPFDAGSIGPLEQSTGVADPGQIDLGPYIHAVDVFLDLSAVNADWIAEVSQDGINWRELARVVQADLVTGGAYFQFDTTFRYARSRYLGAEGDVTTHETSAKGV